MAALVTLAEIKDYLVISSTNQDAKLANLITYASDLVESYCSRSFASANVYEYHDGGSPYVLLDRPPVNNVWSVSEYDGTQYVPLNNPPSTGLPNVSSNANSTPGYTFNSDLGKVWKGFNLIDTSSTSGDRVFRAYPQGIQISYNGGYVTVPSDIKLCVLDIIKSLHKGIDAQVTRFDRELIQQPTFSGGFPPHIRRVLDLYRLIQ